MGRRLRGLYAITPEENDTAALSDKVRRALRGGAAAVQYRNKAAGAQLKRAQALALLEVCRGANAPLVINDDLELALAVNADGLHLGGGDGDLAHARERLGAAKLLGASCYDRLDLALAAQRAGADYVAFGSAFASPTKPGAVRAPLDLFREARTRLTIATVAIGGITPENAGTLIAAGADAIAVVSALFEAPDIESAARRFCALFMKAS